MSNKLLKTLKNEFDSTSSVKITFADPLKKTDERIKLNNIVSVFPSFYDFWGVVGEEV